jgi:hypothetical protein
MSVTSWLLGRARWETIGSLAIVLTAIAAMTLPASANPVLLHAAGSLRTALTEVIAAYADYGLTVMANAPAEAYRFAMFILAPAGQAISCQARLRGTGPDAMMRH